MRRRSFLAGLAAVSGLALLAGAVRRAAGGVCGRTRAIRVRIRRLVRADLYRRNDLAG